MRPIQVLRSLLDRDLQIKQVEDLLWYFNSLVHEDDDEPTVRTVAGYNSSGLKNLKDYRRTSISRGKSGKLTKTVVMSPKDIIAENQVLAPEQMSATAQISGTFGSAVYPHSPVQLLAAIHRGLHHSV